MGVVFRNQQAFDDPSNRLAATGVDLRQSNAITDPQGHILAYAQTGGILSPARREISAGVKLFRFGSSKAGATRVAAGAWWLEQTEFDKIFRFSQVWNISVPLAMRLLCLVPPEWSDMTLLIRARAVVPLLAWRGLSMSVVTPAKGGGPPVRMPHQNDIAARRVYQLFIPGVTGQSYVQSGLTVEQEYPFDAAAGQRFLYL